MAKKCKMLRSKPVKFGVRERNRCRVCGRPRGFLRRFELCRICFRLRSANGDIPGVVKSSW